MPLDRPILRTLLAGLIALLPVLCCCEAMAADVEPAADHGCCTVPADEPAHDEDCPSCEVVVEAAATPETVKVELPAMTPGPANRLSVGEASGPAFQARPPPWQVPRPPTLRSLSVLLTT